MADALTLIEQRAGAAPVQRAAAWSNQDMPMVFGVPAQSSHRRGFQYAPINDPDDLEVVPSLIHDSQTIGVIRPGNLSQRVAVSKAFIRDLSMNGQKLTAQRVQLSIAPLTYQRFYFAPAIAAFKAGVTVDIGGDMLSAGIGLNLNNQNGQKTTTAIARVISYIGSATGPGGAMTGDTDEIELSVGLGVQDNVLILPQTIQQSGPEHAALEGYGTRKLSLVGPAGPLVLRDPASLAVYQPANIIGLNGADFGVIADPDAGGTVDFAASSRPFYAVEVYNASPTDTLTGQAISLTGFYGQILLDCIAAMRAKGKG